MVISGGATATRDTVLDLTTGFSQVGDAQYKTAAETTPIINGSVIQSSVNDVLGVDTTKTTLDFTRVAGGEYVDINLGDSVDSVDSVEIYTGDDGLSASVDIYKKSLTNGNFYVANGVASYDSDEQDYLSLGLWAYAPNQSGTPEIGAYADGGDLFIQANIEGLTGSANYNGGAIGVYNSDIGADFVTGDVALTANFDAGTISGDITNISSIDDIQSFDGVTVVLQDAVIDNSQEGGFWTGDTLTSSTQDSAEYDGQWGGQFYGNGANASDKPEFVAGTFGGATAAVANTEAIGAFVGAFFAEKD